MRKRIKEIERKIHRTQDWEEKGKLIMEAFKLSAELMKCNVPAEKHSVIDKVVKTIINNRGEGWFCDKQQELIITTNDYNEIAKYAANWLAKAREAGLTL
jgi:hypothetical protein